MRTAKHEQRLFIENLKSQLKEAQQKQGEVDHNAVGWLVISPIATYRGYSYGRYFQRGFCFVPEDLPDSKMIVARMCGDLHYKSAYFGPHQRAELIETIEELEELSAFTKRERKKHAIPKCFG